MALYEAAVKERFHLIFLDVEMPNVNGFQLAEKLTLKKSYMASSSSTAFKVPYASSTTPWTVT